VISRSAVLAVVLLAPPALAGGVGEFTSADLGAPKRAGSARYDAAAQEYTLTGAGLNMWGTRDEFQFAWKKLTGDFILQARVKLVGKGVDPHRKLGLIVRSTLDADSPYADAALHGDGLTSLQFRKTKGGETEEAKSTVTGPDFLQLERRKNTYILSVAHFGEPLTVTQVTDLPLGDEVYAGLFVCSHNPEVSETGVFQDVRVIRPVKEGFRPYQDFIGSRLEILDAATGRRELIHAAKEPFEAPNWTHDGKALIFNSSGSSEGRGRLHRFDLATRKATLIDTGTNIRNNNDHVLSFDGKQLAISDQSQGGESAVYTVPVTGGVPKRITPNVPSYLHGWSPDGKSLVFVGGRKDEYDIYKIPSDGSGPEVRLTTTKGLDDGPEYSPDGKYIYFNSVRSGLMQLWRMKPDATQQEAVTNDGFNNWFPHVSPDGKWIAFLSFGTDVDPGDHPYYKQVLLRIMPAAGGPAKVVAYIYGGQGTINVPSWAPDSKRLAFVSNSDEP
jgi:Tol biopolymer transport system component